MGGTEPPPSQLLTASVFCEDVGASWGGGVGAFASRDNEDKLSLDVSRLFLSASNRSTRSLHCSSSCRRDSSKALSVSEAGRYVEGLRRELW